VTPDKHARGEAGRIVVRRLDDSAGMLRRIRIEVDGTELARLRPGEVAALPVETGRHQVRARLDWTASDAVVVEVVPGRDARLTVSLPWSGLWTMISSPRSTLKLDVD
jgi:hypothetical protein